MSATKGQVELLLREFWRDRAIALSDSPGSIDDLGAPLDSLTSMEAIMEIDALLGCKLPVDRIIRQGGYDSEDDFVSEVASKVLEVLQETHNE